MFYKTVSVAAAALLLLSGCSGDSANKDSAFDSPLSKYLGALYAGKDYSQEEALAEQKRVQEVIAKCMQEEGFEYTAYVPAEAAAVQEVKDDQEQIPGTVTFAEKYGYGLLKNPWSEPSVNTATQNDPNVEYTNKLSESESAAYYEALYGPAPTEEEMADSVSGFELPDTGCYYTAIKASNSDDQISKLQSAYEDPEFADLFKDMEKFYNSTYSEEVSTIKEVADLQKTWADCFADAGFVAVTPTAAERQIADEVYGPLWASQEDSAASHGAENDPKFAEAFEKEVQTAVADAKCREKVDYTKKLEKLQYKAEEDFISQNKEKLDALIAKYGNKK